MGFWRIFYNTLGLDYIGSYERNQINKQTRLKFHLHRQIRDTNLNKFLFKKVNYNIKKRNKKVSFQENRILMGIPITINKIK